MRSLVVFLVCILVLNLSACVSVSGAKRIVGATATVQIEEAGLQFSARVDTGAATCSIHAENITLINKENKQNQSIAFTLVNKQGESRVLQSQVHSRVTIKTSEGSELRYKVPLSIKWNDMSKTVLVTLNDRSRMQYALLLGRNWLQDDFLVDVDKVSD